MDRDEIASVVDFSEEAFIQMRDPVNEMIDTFSGLYIDSEEEKEKSAMQDQPGEPDDFNALPPPPPLVEFEEEQVYSNGMVTVQRLTNVEEHLSDIEHRLSDCVSQETVIDMMKKLEDKINYHIQRETDRIKTQIDSKIADLGQSMVDCLKRRDKQLDQRIQALNPLSSTPISATTISQKTTSMQKQSSSSQQYMSLPTIPAPYNPPVKLEFPSFTNASDDDPVVFIERVEEYVNLRPLPDKELLASLAAVLKGTAKDWWSAEKKNVGTWKCFKDKFLFAFLNEDFKEVAAQRLINRRQQNKESIRDFAYHYRALCMRNNPKMNETDIVNAILRNCNPRLASLLRSSAKTVDELVRLGTQIEKDWMGAKNHWSLVNSEEQNRKLPAAKSKRENQLMLVDHHNASQGYRALQLPVTINHTNIDAIIDTGSTFSIVQRKIWKELSKEKSDQFTTSNQNFILANGQCQKAIGKVRLMCEIKEEKIEVDFFVMEDKDLAVSVILGLDFLKKSKMVLDFNTLHFHLPEVT